MHYNCVIYPKCFLYSTSNILIFHCTHILMHTHPPWKFSFFHSHYLNYHHHPCHHRFLLSKLKLKKRQIRNQNVTYQGEPLIWQNILYFEQFEIILSRIGTMALLNCVPWGSNCLIKYLTSRVSMRLCQISLMTQSTLFHYSSIPQSNSKKIPLRKLLEQ